MTELLNRYLVPVLRRLSENTYLSAIRAGMIAIVPLTIIGGLFLVVSEMPAASWQAWVTPCGELWPSKPAKMPLRPEKAAEILGVDVDADHDEVLAAYRKLAV